MSSTSGHPAIYTTFKYSQMMQFQEEPEKRQPPTQPRNLELPSGKDSTEQSSNDYQPRQIFCFIDEQELRRPGNNPVRRAVRSRARRDADLKRQLLNTAARMKLGNPRRLLVRSQPHVNTAVLPHRDVLAAIQPPIGISKLQDSGIGM